MAVCSIFRCRVAGLGHSQKAHPTNALNGYDFEDLEIGMSATFSKTITEADIILFAGASGDNNAIHINDEFAQTTPFKGRIAQTSVVLGNILR